MFFYFLYMFGYFLANVLPLKGAYWLAERFADIRYSIASVDREAVAENLSIVTKKDMESCRKEARKVFRSFGLYLADFFRMSRLEEKTIKELVKTENINVLDKVLEQKNGAIILSGHLGNWEMGGVAVAMLGYKISAVALNHKHKNINDFFIAQRENKGLKVITMKSVMKKCVSTLLKKEILALVGDRNFTNGGIETDFFGKTTSIPKGPAALSFKTGAPIIPTFFIREGRMRYRFIFDYPINPADFKEQGKEEAIEQMTKKFVGVMEKYIRKNPEQWLLFRRFWETPKDAFVL